MKVLIIKKPLFYQVTTITPLLDKEGVGGGLVDYIISTFCNLLLYQGFHLMSLQQAQRPYLSKVLFEKRMLYHNLRWVYLLFKVSFTDFAGHIFMRKMDMDAYINFTIIPVIFKYWNTAFAPQPG